MALIAQDVEEVSKVHATWGLDSYKGRKEYGTPEGQEEYVTLCVALNDKFQKQQMEKHELKSYSDNSGAISSELLLNAPCLRLDDNRKLTGVQKPGPRIKLEEYDKAWRLLGCETGLHDSETGRDVLLTIQSIKSETGKEVQLTIKSIKKEAECL